MTFDVPEAAGNSSGGLTRRTVVKGAVWSMPVIAVAATAPAAAASPCTPSTNLDGMRPGRNVITSIPFIPGGVTAAITYASNGQGGDATPGGTGTVAATNTNPSWNYIEIEMVSGLSQGDWVELTFAFSTPVESLRFTIHDIDKVSGQWLDEVIVSGNNAGANTPYTSALGSNVRGSGTAASPFNPIAWGDNPIDSGLNRVTVTFTGTVTQLKIRYRAGITGRSNNQHIGLGNLSFSACPTPTSARSIASRSLAAEPALRSLPADADGFAQSEATSDS